MKNLELTKEEIDNLVEEAFKALENSYSPYSNFSVGACVLTKDGKYFRGTNVENASFGLTNCAERSALFTAYSDGVRRDDILAIAVVANSENLATPCGACRQVLSELVNIDTPIILSNGTYTEIVDIEKLLPMAFKL